MADIDLRPADKLIIEVLREGRNTVPNIREHGAESDEYKRYTRIYLHQRMKALREAGIVERVDTGLYKIAEGVDE